jgi:uncharacterized protein GlcG (DUF336 family)
VGRGAPESLALAGGDKSLLNKVMALEKNIMTSHSISAHLARELLAAAQKQASEMGLAVSICILDAAGRLKAFVSMDGAAPISHETAVKKAKMALGFGMPTGEDWYSFIKNDPILLHGVTQLPDFILLGGGSPLKWNQHVIGAIGVSGGHYKQDETCVTAAIQLLNQLAST